MPLKAGDIQSSAPALNDLAAPAQHGVYALKLPDSWTDKPEVWIARVEAQFGTLLHFLALLPAEVRSVLAVRKINDFDELADQVVVSWRRKASKANPTDQHLWRMPPRRALKIPEI